MASLNKTTLIGNTAASASLRVLPNGTQTCTIKLATTDTWKDKQTNQKRERTEWHRVVFYGPLANIVCQYVQKGMQLYIEGANRTRKWTDDGGTDRYVTEIIATEMQMLGKKSDNVPAPPRDDTPDMSDDELEDHRHGIPIDA